MAENGATLTGLGSDDNKLARACDTCRRRKVRCSGVVENLGKCTNCSKHDIPCTFVTGVRKRGPPRGYVEELEKRVAQLESQLRRASSQSNGSPSRGRGDSLASGGRTPPEASGAKVSPVSEEDEMVEQMREWNLCGHYFGRTGVASTIVMFDAIRMRATGTPPELEVQMAFAKLPPSFLERLFEWDTLAELAAHPLPEPDLVQHLVKLYFERINVIIPLLHQPSFERHLQSDLAATSPSFRSLVFAVMASASRFSDDPRTLHAYPWIRHPQGDQPEKVAAGFSFMQAAIKLAFTIAPTSLFTLQSFTLTCEYVAQAGSALIAWQLVGWTARMMITSGAHCLISPGWNSSFMVDELRKRCFWHFYVLDRSISMNMGRPFAVADDIIDVDLPLDIDDATLEYYDRLALPFPRNIPMPAGARKGNVECLRQWAQLSRLYERIAEACYAAHPQPDHRTHVTALESVVNQWLENLPKELRWSPVDPNDDVVARSALVLSAFYGTLITIHRSAIRPQSQFAVERCLPAIRSAAIDLSHILDACVKRGVALQSWMHTLPHACQAGMLVLVGAYLPDKIEPLNEQLEAAFRRLIRFLEAIGEMSWAAARISTLLNGGYERLLTDMSRTASHSASYAAMPAFLGPNGQRPSAAASGVPSLESPLSPETLKGLMGVRGMPDMGFSTADFGTSAAGGASSQYDMSALHLGSTDWLNQYGVDFSVPPTSVGAPSSSTGPPSYSF